MPNMVMQVHLEKVQIGAASCALYSEYKYLPINHLFGVQQGVRF
jgi:hypothetical protein